MVSFRDEIGEEMLEYDEIIIFRIFVILTPNFEPWELYEFAMVEAVQYRTN